MMVPWRMTAAIGLVSLCALSACTQTPPPPSATAVQDTAQPQPMPPEESEGNSTRVKPQTGQLDRSGREQVGRASFIATSLADRKMANGQRLDPDSKIIASKT